MRSAVRTPLWLTCPPAGVLYLGRADGVLEVWDLLDRSHEPSMTANPTSSAITSLSFSPAGAPAAPGGRAVQQLLAVGEPRVPFVQYAPPGPAAQQQQPVWCQPPEHSCRAAAQALMGGRCTHRSQVSAWRLGPSQHAPRGNIAAALPPGCLKW